MSESESRTLTIEPKSKLQVEAEFKAALRQRRMLDGSTLPVKSTLPVPGDSHPASKTKKKRKYKPATERLYARIREIPRSVRLKEFCRRCDAPQRISFPVPKDWRAEGCPDTWLSAWEIPKWRERIHNLRQNAWRDVPKRDV